MAQAVAPRKRVGVSEIGHITDRQNRSNICYSSVGQVSKLASGLGLRMTRTKCPQPVKSGFPKPIGISKLLHLEGT